MSATSYLSCLSATHVQLPLLPLPAQVGLMDNQTETIDISTAFTQQVVAKQAKAAPWRDKRLSRQFSKKGGTSTRSRVASTTGAHPAGLNLPSGGQPGVGASVDIDGVESPMREGPRSESGTTPRFMPGPVHPLGHGAHPASAATPVGSPSRGKRRAWSVSGLASRHCSEQRLLVVDAVPADVAAVAQTVSDDNQVLTITEFVAMLTDLVRDRQ